MQNKLVRVATLMAYFMLLRQSEYIYSARENDHAVKAKHVEFKLFKQMDFVEASGVAEVSYAEVESVRITLPHCKNDVLRRGNPFWYESGSAEANEFYLVREMFNWSRVARFMSEDVFTSFRDDSGKLHR
jgi:hypothetical protein